MIAAEEEDGAVTFHPFRQPMAEDSAAAKFHAGLSDLTSLFPASPPSPIRRYINDYGLIWQFERV